MADDGVLAFGNLYRADFKEKRLTIRVEGDMPTVSRGRYALVSAERLRMVVMQANAWQEQQRAGKNK